MSKWPRGVDGCKKCTGDSRFHAYGAKGVCRRCYAIEQRIEQVRRWNQNERDTLIGFSDSPAFNSTDEEFEINRDETIRQLHCRLKLLRRREEIRRCEIPIEPLDLENKFLQLQHLVRRKAKYLSHASYLADHFDPGQRRVLYALLEEIIESVPWRGIDVGKIFARITEFRASKKNL
jgi:hypothetical protein